MLLVKLPVPVPLFVSELETVGFVEVLQQTPRAVTVAPPSEVTLPPLVAVVWAIALVAVVVTVGATMVAEVVKLIWFP